MFIGVFLLSAAFGHAVIVDGFDGYVPGAVISPWVGTDGTAVIGQDAGGNQYIQGTGAYLPLDSFAIPAADTATTVFFRVYKLSGYTQDCSAGLSHMASPTGDWTNLEAYISVVGNDLRGRNNSANTSLMTISNDTWYNVWLVLNNNANTYDIYVTTGSQPATSGDLKANDYGFRNDGGDLLSFKLYGRAANGAIRIDDIGIAAGTDLSIPSGGALPAVITSGPANVSMAAGEPAAFTTVFTSATEPVVTWYKIASPANIVIDPAEADVDVELTCDAQAGEYTSTLTLANAAIADSGQYYCRVNNESGYPRNSAAATLTVLGLVSRWTFDQADYASGQYLDVIGGSNADAAGTPIFAAGANGAANGAVQITPTSGFAQVDGFDPRATGQLTVSVWVNWLEAAMDDLAITSPSNAQGITAAGGLGGGQWQHLCIVMDAASGKIYIDGTLRAEGSFTLPQEMSSLLEIGAADGTEAFNGCLDDLRIYNYALTAGQIEQIYDEMAVCRLAFDISGPAGQPDCAVDLYDLTALAGDWLAGYDYEDFAGLSKEWLLSGNN